MAIRLRFSQLAASRAASGRHYDRFFEIGLDNCLAPMTWNRFRTFALACSFTVAGCATTTHLKPPVAEELPYRYGIAWGPSGRGGAAERASDYIHVIHRARTYALTRTKLNQASSSAIDEQVRAGKQHDVSTDIAQWVETLLSTLDSVPKRQNPEKTKERLAWERYCNGGLGLTEDEWTFLTYAGAPRNIPADLSSTCVPPK